ncbi:MAG: LPS export ABC transporter ATP-binding protein [Gammaproteobacteria bacterium]|jgi:lipopolysaccharide export system ATP-binding protein|nr:LPS export ABC transporter ATP-binding protein [Gammaproteobacteria bacterium]MBT5406870.1 LPS export ABC transporter ATP-binding protein [Gammaproteobacteria bacterium]MBT5644373.1 LPS export ABC transporter ATP-binding protein [Gammaproteobacteria bacterium]MBT5863064.1 LPS export ABC transporter ATP-binding protein [Gammaproteobacteria bacterium]MBT6734537.1 LPS export ABC transporter ATP-binding protein [Gammaproteobacteria bacterium]|tara:strand:+ start:368 stop:1093 length:726 start_codon:yes stop_codon:yes gene_type:complete
MTGLDCINLNKKYNGKTVVHDISINLQANSVIGLLGPNGAGKTTTFYMLVGLIKSNSGTITINDDDITSLPMHMRSDLGISYLPQEASIFRNLSVKDNILAILETRKHLTSSKIDEKFQSLINTLKIEHILSNKGASLSGGERRRVEIARALATEPKFLLLDEPFAGIDPLSVIEIQKIIKELVKSNIGVLITDHNVRETLKVCDQAYIISDGKVIAHGKPSEIIKDKIVQDVYLGDNFKL